MLVTADSNVSVVHKHSSCYINSSVYVAHNTVSTISYKNSDSWITLNSIEQSIKKKIEKVGVPLKDWDISINYGIKTGLNDAFIISTEKKDELIAADPKSAEIIRPILRGRDIKRYEYHFAELWIIATFPSKKYNIDDYPAIKNYLLSFGIERLEQTGNKQIVNGVEIRSRKKTSNKWFETQDSISYWNDLNKQKIIWGEISDKPKFSIDENGQYFPEATTFLMTGNHLKYLLGFLNSTFSEYFFAKYGTTTGMGTLRWKKYLIELLPIPVVTPEKENEFVSLVDQVLMSNGKDQMAIEQVDNAIYMLLNFDATEIDFIENMVKQGAH
mgnify:CR=1 FL=1